MKKALSQRVKQSARSIKQSKSIKPKSVKLTQLKPKSKEKKKMDQKFDSHKLDQNKPDPNKNKPEEKPNAFPSDTAPKQLDPSKPIDPSHHPTTTAGAQRENLSAGVGEEKKDKLGQETDKHATETEEYTGPGSTNRSLGNTAQPFTKENLKEMDEKAGNAPSDVTPAKPKVIVTDKGGTKK